MHPISKPQSDLLHVMSSRQLLLYLKCGAALPKTACVRRRDVHPGAHESDGAQSGGGSGGLPPPEALLRLHRRRAVVAAVRRRCASHFWLHPSGPPVSAAGRPQNLRVGDQLGPTAKPPYGAQIMMRQQIYTVEGIYAAAPCSNKNTGSTTLLHRNPLLWLRPAVLYTPCEMMECALSRAGAPQGEKRCYPAR